MPGLVCVSRDGFGEMFIDGFLGRGRLVEISNLQNGVFVRNENEGFRDFGGGSNGDQSILVFEERSR